MMMLRTIKNKKQRKMLFITLYQWALSGNDPKQIAAENSKENPELQSWLAEELTLVANKCDSYDQQINQVSDKPCNKFAAIELALLRLGCHEIHQFPDPKDAGFLISECLMLTKDYIDPNSQKMIHGILNALIKSKQNHAPTTKE
jgi:transcription termination factor NusB